MTSGRNRSIASSFHTTAPSLGGSMPAIMLSSVVLPDPFGPMMPTISPRSTPKDTSETATSPRKRFVRPRTSSSTPCSPRVQGADDPARHDEDREDQDRAIQDR